LYLDEGSSGQTTSFQLSDSSNPESELAFRQLHQVVDKELNHLPGLFRHVVILRYVQGLPVADVAEKLGISVAAAKSRVARARLKLRSRLTDGVAVLVNPRAKQLRLTTVAGDDLICLHDPGLGRVCARKSKHKTIETTSAIHQSTPLPGQSSLFGATRPDRRRYRRERTRRTGQDPASAGLLETSEFLRKPGVVRFRFS
jgi:sigma-70-like protein